MYTRNQNYFQEIRPYKGIDMDATPNVWAMELTVRVLE